MSVPQMPAACTSTSTSPGPACGSGTSSTVKRLPPRQVASFIRLPVQPHVLHAPVVVESVVRDEVLHVGIVREVFLPPAEHGARHVGLDAALDLEDQLDALGPVELLRLLVDQAVGLLVATVAVVAGGAALVVFEEVGVGIVEPARGEIG